jgi:hypothetical protein
MEIPPENTGSVWFRHARQVARKVNLGWWLQSLSTPLVVTGLAGSCALLLVRRSSASPALWMLASGATGVVLAIALICWLMARRSFEKPDQSLVRIEAAMKLRNSLSAAKAGVTPWPAVPAKVDAGLDWRWQRVIVPPLATICFLTAGLVIPISAGGRPAAAPSDEPLAWQNIEADLKRLEENKDVIDESYIEEMKKQVDELKEQDQQEWFSHSSLEATDSLKQQHASNLEKMERELGRADKAIGDLQKNADGMTPAQKEGLKNQLDEALKNLQNSALKPNSKLMDQLKGLDPKALGQMDPDKLKQLKDSMKKAAQAAKDCQSDGKGDGDGKSDQWNDELNDGNGNGDGKDGQGNGDGNGDGEGDQNGNGAGSGAPDRGPGHSAGMLGKEHDKTKTGDLTGIDSKDLSHALPGDLLELQNGEHDVDKSTHGPQAGGATNASGTGGDRVWKESLDPAEQKALKKFFE